jgi:katanin p80 WD40 repeat-containing subunit B1
MFVVAQKLTGHLTQCTAIQTEKNNSMNVIVSGAMDTNVKLWDVRQKSCVNTYKAHNKEITCVDLSPDSKLIVSGSMDGTLKFWDTCGQRLVKSIKASRSGYPTCVSFNPQDLTVVVGLSNKCIKYYELQEFELVSSSTIDTLAPRAICFNNSGMACFVAYDDCTKVYHLEDEIKPKVMDVIAKPYK